MNRDEFYSHVSADAIRRAVDQVGTPCYLYFPSILRTQVRRVRECIGDRFDLHFAVKSNPNSAILREMARLGVGADVASGGELRRALEAGIPAERIQFSGPGKQKLELEQAIRAQIAAVNVESLGEISQLAEQARMSGRRARVGIRVNPGGASAKSGMRMGGDTQFGIGVDQVPKALEGLSAESAHLEFTGFHSHIASQELNASTIADGMRALLDVAIEARNQAETGVEWLNFGGGWGIKYFQGQEHLSLESLRTQIEAIASTPKYKSLVDEARLIVEPGRFLVGECGVFATRVLYVKQAASKTFVIVDGGMNANYVLAGGMGAVIRRNFEFDVLHEGEGAPAEQVFDVAGPLCTPQDVLAIGAIATQEVLPGDVVVFFNCGAYGPSASPLGFLSHPAPQEVLVDDSGTPFGR